MTFRPRQCLAVFSLADVGAQISHRNMQVPWCGKGGKLDFKCRSF